MRFAKHCFLYSFVLLVVGPALAEPISDQAVAERHGIAVRDVERLHNYRHLTNDDLIRMTPAKVRRALWRLDNPKPDQPLGAAQYRRLLLLGDARYETPPNALGRAIARVDELRSTISARARRPASARSYNAPAASGRPDIVTIGGIPVGEFVEAPTRPAARTIAPGVPVRPDAGLLKLEVEPLARAAPFARSLAPPQALSPTEWKWLGPGNVGGRTRAILIHPTQPEIMWLASVAGGIWKSVNSGQSWAPLADFMANLNVSSLVLDPANPELLFAGTGEGYYNLDAFRGAGVFRSTDGGATWEQLPSTDTPDFQYVNRIALTGDGGAMIVATQKGVFRSTNWREQGAASITFSPVSDLAGRDVLDIDCSRANPLRCVAGGRGRSAWFSRDGGGTWALAAGLPSPQPTETFAGRVELTYAAADPNIVYASIDENGGQLLRSTDGGESFTLRHSATPYLSGQGWYNNAIWAGDPTRPDLVIVGGLDLYRSTDGGQTLTQISQWWQAPASAHADHHVIVAHPNYDGTANRIVYFGNDGGIYRNDDVLSAFETTGWVALNNNYGVTQFYGAAGNIASGRIVGGTQDNGTILYRPPPGTNTGPLGYTAMYGGDGGYSAADPQNPNFMYGEYVYLQIHRSVNGGDSADYIYSGIEDAGDGNRALFIAPFILDPEDPNTMLAGGASLWRSRNVRAATPSWRRIKDASGGLISAIEARASTFGAGKSNVVWVGYIDGRIEKSSNADAQRPAWQRVDENGAKPLPDRMVTRIRVDPTRSNTAYASFGGYQAGNLWKTVDGGQNWQEIGSSLPEVTVFDIAMHPRDTRLLYAATEVGVFASADEGQTWWPTNQGPANVSVSELFWMEEKLIAVTHGRGMFWIDLGDRAVAASEAPPAAAAARSVGLAAPATGGAAGEAAPVRSFIVPVSPLNSR
jgi:photosystem II stability/assembly factor-like uncharacterized protein